MRLEKDYILKKIKETGMIPVFYHPNENTAGNIVDACYKGGVRVFEFTNRGPEAMKVFSHLVTLKTKYPDAIFGIGTIMTPEDAVAFGEAGADFIVSPILKESIGEACKAHDLMWIPGCGTLTEIVNAHEGGAPLIKIFPAVTLGPAFVSAIKPVVPYINVMPTGGVDTTRENLKAWFKAGVFCVGMGSQLLKKEYLEKNQWSELEQVTKNTLSIIKEERAE